MATAVGTQFKLMVSLVPPNSYTPPHLTVYLRTVEETYHVYRDVPLAALTIARYLPDLWVDNVDEDTYGDARNYLPWGLNQSIDYLVRAECPLDLAAARLAHVLNPVSADFAVQAMKLVAEEAVDYVEHLLPAGAPIAYDEFRNVGKMVENAFDTDVTF